MGETTTIIDPRTDPRLMQVAQTIDFQLVDERLRDLISQPDSIRYFDDVREFFLDLMQHKYRVISRLGLTREGLVLSQDDGRCVHTIKDHYIFSDEINLRLFEDGSYPHFRFRLERDRGGLTCAINFGRSLQEQFLRGREGHLKYFKMQPKSILIERHIEPGNVEPIASIKYAEMFS